MNPDLKKSEKERVGLSTEFDDMLSLIRQSSSIPIADIAKQLGINKKLVEERAKILEAKKFIEIHYPLIGEPVICVPGHEAKPTKPKPSPTRPKGPLPKIRVAAFTLAIVLAMIGFYLHFFGGRYKYLLGTITGYATAQRAAGGYVWLFILVIVVLIAFSFFMLLKSIRRARAKKWLEKEKKEEKKEAEPAREPEAEPEEEKVEVKPEVKKKKSAEKKPKPEEVVKRTIIRKVLGVPTEGEYIKIPLKEKAPKVPPKTLPKKRIREGWFEIPLPPAEKEEEVSEAGYVEIPLEKKKPARKKKRFKK